MRLALKKITVCVVAVLLATFFWSGFDSAAGSLSETQEKSDAISGLYFLHGTKVSTFYPCLFACFDMEPARDTTFVAFTTNVWLVPEKTDTLRFFGLLGADAGERGPDQFEEFLFPIELHDNGDQYRIFGRIADNSKFEIDLMYAGPRYVASGSFTDNTIQLEGKYQYRNRTFAYDLEGIKIVDE